MKKPDEIKRGMAACAEDNCIDCAYYKGKATCLQSMIADALAYIQHLEAERVADGRRDIRVPTNGGVENDQQKRL